MKKHINGIYLTVILAVCSLVQLDARIFGADIRTVLVMVCVLVFLAARLVADRGFAGIKTDHIDLLVYGSGVLALAGMLYKLVLQPEEYGKYMTLLSLCLLYFTVRNYLRDIHADTIFLGSIFQAVINVLLLCHYVIDAEFVAPVAALFQEGAILSWLILVISINVPGFCVYGGRRIWYGANAIVGFFLLFIQDNAAASVVAGALFLQIAQRYMPRKKTVKRVMQMFFAYAFLLCNMTLIANYTEILVVEVTYDLELSVYMELALAVFGVWFFHTWDKGAGETEDTALPRLREFFKKTAIIAVMVLAAATVAVIRGRTAVLPDLFEKVTALCRHGMEMQAGIFETAAALYGIPGVILSGYFLYNVFDTLRKYRHLKTSRHRKLFRIVAWMFAVQALFLTQSMASVPVYVIFTAVMLNERSTVRCTADQRKGENADEADYPDSMLQ